MPSAPNPLPYADALPLGERILAECAALEDEYNQRLAAGEDVYRLRAEFLRRMPRVERGENDRP